LTAASASITAPLKRKSSPALLFGDDVAYSTENDNGVDIGIAGIDDDWIIDDTGGAITDEASGKTEKDGFIKEMGETVCLL
jgi:hypothetical protein